MREKRPPNSAPMKTRQTILACIEAFLARHAMSERRFGLEAVEDHKLLSRLRAGRVTLATIEKAEAFMQAADRAADAERAA